MNFYGRVELPKSRIIGKFGEASDNPVLRERPGRLDIPRASRLVLPIAAEGRLEES